MVIARIGLQVSNVRGGKGLEIVLNNSLLHEESNKNKVYFRTLETEITDLANVLIPMSSVLEVEARFANTLYGYFLGKKVAFLIVKRYILNAWKKYGITRVMGAKNGFFFMYFSSSTRLEEVLENGHWLIRNVHFILRKWTSSSKLVKEELTYVPMWIKFHGVLVSVLTANGLSVIATRLGTPIMLYSYTLVISIPKAVRNGVTLHTIKCPIKRVMADVRKPKGTSNDGSKLSKGSIFEVLFVAKGDGSSFSALEEDNEKPMDDLVDDTRKKMKAPPKKTPRKTSIWSGRKADSPKRNVVFSLEAQAHYFDRDDMDFDDMRHAVEEMEHKNAYSKNG
ncbi:zinc knuckle CX2CX4HX4C containing protein [Tanacetum coccineum]